MASLDSKPVADLTEAEALDALTALADEIAAHDIRYYQDEAPAVSDADYDALKRRNGEIEARFPHLIRDNSPSLRVGAARAEQFAPVEHGVPLLSLDNAFSNDDAVEFDARVRRFLRLGGVETVGYTAEPVAKAVEDNIGKVMTNTVGRLYQQWFAKYGISSTVSGT